MSLINDLLAESETQCPECNGTGSKYSTLWNENRPCELCCGSGKALTPDGEKLLLWVDRMNRHFQRTQGALAFLRRM